MSNNKKKHFFEGLLGTKSRLNLTAINKCLKYCCWISLAETQTQGALVEGRKSRRFKKEKTIKARRGSTQFLNCHTVPRAQPKNTALVPGLVFPLDRFNCLFCQTRNEKGLIKTKTFPLCDWQSWWTASRDLEKVFHYVFLTSQSSARRRTGECISWSAVPPVRFWMRDRRKTLRAIKPGLEKKTVNNNTIAIMTARRTITTSIMIIITVIFIIQIRRGDTNVGLRGQDIHWLKKPPSNKSGKWWKWLYST